MNISLDDVSSLIIDKLKQGGSITFSPKGKSMLPLLRDGQDEITLIKPPYRLKKYDIALYTRNDNQYVLHRVIKIKDNMYVMRGDNQIYNEYGVCHDKIIGIVVAYKRKDKEKNIKSFSYKLYLFYLSVSYPFRWLFTKIKSLGKKIFKKNNG